MALFVLEFADVDFTFSFVPNINEDKILAYGNDLAVNHGADIRHPDALFEQIGKRSTLCLCCGCCCVWAVSHVDNPP